MNADTINVLTKKALKGDVNSLKEIIKFLKGYNAPIAKFAIYSIIYQFTMNNIIDLVNECKTCGGKCCKVGLPVPVYHYDYEEMQRHLRIKLERKNGFYLLPRPCKFQKDWMCSINSFKPYACLSYPFATEDEQIEVIKNYDGNGVPDFQVPEFCLAGAKVKKFLNSLIENLKREKRTEPDPEEIIDVLLKVKRQ